MNKSLVVTASNWVSFVGSLKANLKLGYGQCDKKYYQNGFYTAILEQAVDSAYLQALQQLTGEEKDGDCHKDTFLGVEPRTEASEEVLEASVEAVGTGSVITKIKRQPRSKK